MAHKLSRMGLRVHIIIAMFSKCFRPQFTLHVDFGCFIKFILSFCLRLIKNVPSVNIAED